MNNDVKFARSELILGGQKSGKSRRAELLARDWLSASSDHQAVLIATGQAHDEEMSARIARHRLERTERVPGMSTVEEPLLLAEKIAELSNSKTLLVVDCVMLWLVNWLMPMGASNAGISSVEYEGQAARLTEVINNAPGPIVLVSNEIGLGVIPMGQQVRAFVDALGVLNQRIAAVCDRVTLVAAGLPLTLKGAA